VWLNPPFSDKERWYRRLIGQLNEGNATKAVAVAPVDPSTEWFQRWFSRSTTLCLLEGRGWFTFPSGEASGNASFSTMVGVWNASECDSALQRLGTVYKPVDQNRPTQTEL